MESNDLSSKLELHFSSRLHDLDQKFTEDLERLERLKLNFVEMYHECDLLINPPQENDHVEQPVQESTPVKKVEKPKDDGRSKTPIKQPPTPTAQRDPAPIKKDVKEPAKQDARSKTPIMVKKDVKAAAKNDLNKSTNNLTKVDSKPVDKKPDKKNVKDQDSKGNGRDLTPTPGAKKRSILDTSADLTSSQKIHTTKNDKKTSAHITADNEKKLSSTMDKAKNPKDIKRESATGNIDTTSQNKPKKSISDKKSDKDESAKAVPSKEEDENNETLIKEIEDNEESGNKKEDDIVSEIKAETPRENPKVESVKKEEEPEPFSKKAVKCMLILIRSR